MLSAKNLATYAHRNQKRKYTDEPYIVHPEEVASIVAQVTDDPDIIAAAWLHDTIEDTDVVAETIELICNPRVAKLVLEVTNVSRPSDGNRATRKGIDRLHLFKASPEGKTIKLADIISNCSSIMVHDPGFARIYLKEKAMLLEMLRDGNSKLFAQAEEIIHGRKISC